METNENLNLIEEVKKISQMYFLALNTKEGDDEVMLKNHQFVLKVENAFEKLDDLEKYVINSEFFYQNYAGWWQKQYSRSSYYRLKMASVKHFLMAFKDEN